MSVQYCGGCSVLRGDSISIAEGQHQYCGGIASVLRRDSISTAEGWHQCCGGCSVPRSTEPTLYGVIKVIVRACHGAYFLIFGAKFGFRETCMMLLFRISVQLSVEHLIIYAVCNSPHA